MDGSDIGFLSVSISLPRGERMAEAIYLVVLRLLLLISRPLHFVYDVLVGYLMCLLLLVL